jgi:hypothetical protein
MPEEAINQLFIQQLRQQVTRSLAIAINGPRSASLLMDHGVQMNIFNGLVSQSCRRLTAFARYFAILPVVATTILGAQNEGPRGEQIPSTQDIVSRMQAENLKRATALREYVSERNYDLDYHGFPSNKHAVMTVKVHLTAPDKKELVVTSERGSGLLRNRVLRPLLDSEREGSSRENQNATALTEANYEFSFAGQEDKDGRHCYVLDVKPKKKNKFLYVGRIWIDSADYAVVHISAQPAKNPSFWITHVQIEHEYAKYGELWLPQRNHSVSSIRFGGRAVLAIDYGQYAVHPAQEQSLSIGNKAAPLAP